MRCGRRLNLASPQAVPRPYALSSSASPSMTATAAASALESLPSPKNLPARPPQPLAPESDPQERPGYQGSLFQGFGAPKVIPIPTLTPLHPPSRESHSTRRVQTRQAPRPRRASNRVGDSQQALEFQEAETASDSLNAQADLIYCDAPVALPAHRMVAAAVDTSMVLVGLGVFLFIFFLGGDLEINRGTVPFLIGVGAVIAFFYRSLWYFGNGDTPGMRFAGLRLVDFDGRRPDREQRRMRLVAGLLSLSAAGLGLVWALVDEENLTWHDHISKTFPTPG
jgi:uncharacterized RDD family membrane protein YckC